MNNKGCYKGLQKMSILAFFGTPCETKIILQYSLDMGINHRNKFSHIFWFSGLSNGIIQHSYFQNIGFVEPKEANKFLYKCEPSLWSIVNCCQLTFTIDLYYTHFYVNTLSQIMLFWGHCKTQNFLLEDNLQLFPGLDMPWDKPG